MIKKPFRFRICVLDTLTDQNQIDIKNLGLKEFKEQSKLIIDKYDGKKRGKRKCLMKF